VIGQTCAGAPEDTKPYSARDQAERRAEFFMQWQALPNALCIRVFKDTLMS